VRTFVELLLALIGLVVVVVAGLGGLAQLKFTSFLTESTNERLEIVAATSAQDFGAAIDLGLTLAEVANGQAILDRARSHDPAISAILVFDLEGTILHAVGEVNADRVDDETFEAFRLARLGITEARWGIEDDARIGSGIVVEGSFGQALGGIVVEYPTTENGQQASTMARQLILDGVAVAGAMSVVVLVMLVLFRSRLFHVEDVDVNRPESPMNRTLTRPQLDARAERRSRGLVVWISLLLIVGVAAYGLLIVRDFNQSLEPELARRANLIGETIRDDAERALEVGIPLAEFVGVDEYFAVFLTDFPELDYLAIRDDRGEVLYAAGALPPRVPVQGGQQTSDEPVIGNSIVYEFAVDDGNVTIGSIDVGVDPFFVRSKLRDLALDVGVILIVALVVAFEVTLELSRRIVARPSRLEPAAVTGGAGGIRLVLFLFVVGEELNKSFLPLFIEAADNPIPGLETKVAISLPIMAFLLTLAVASPLAGRLVNAFGHRGLFLIGVTASASSHLGMVYADNVVQIMGLRALTGVGYGLVTIAWLEYTLDRQSQASRARAIGVFVAVVIGGTFAGTALGGILADRLGFQAVFVISFALVVVAGLFALRMMQPRTADGTERPKAFSMRDVAAVLKRPSFLFLLGGVTIPMNVLMAAFLWYLVPLTLAALGSNPSAIARTLMVYYLVILVGGPLAGKLTETRIDHWALVGVGSVVSAAVLLMPAFAPSALTISLAVLVVGVGHAAVRGPQVSLALDIADAEVPVGGRGAVLAAMRSLERIGSLAGLLVVAVLAARFDLNVAVGAIGVAAAVAGLVFLVAGRFVAPRSTVV
jgi:MFS family permease